jgi:hypothetical protein
MNDIDEILHPSEGEFRMTGSRREVQEKLLPRVWGCPPDYLKSPNV